MSTADVKVDVVATGAGVPKHAKLAQILSILVSGVIALAVSSVLADGQSVIILKPVKDLPPATNPELKKLVSHHKENHIQLKYNLAELLGPGYGVGLHHDQSGHIWNGAGAEDHDLAFLIKDLGIDLEEAVSVIINGFCKEVFNELPMEFAVEATKLLGLKLEGSVG